jgi:hypothetical protein
MRRVVNAAPRPLYPPGKRCRTHCIGGCGAPVWTGAENIPPTGIRSPDLPVRSESLYRLSYPGSIFHSTVTQSRCPHKSNILYFLYSVCRFAHTIKTSFPWGFKGLIGCSVTASSVEWELSVKPSVKNSKFYIRRYTLQEILLLTVPTVGRLLKRCW